MLLACGYFEKPVCVVPAFFKRALVSTIWQTTGSDACHYILYKQEEPLWNSDKILFP